MKFSLFHLPALLAGMTALSMGSHVHAMPFSGMYVFGDSLSDNGNLYLMTGGASPTSPPYAPGLFQDGPTYADNLWGMLGLPGALTPSVLGGTNFAVGGARSRYHSADLVNGIPPTGPATYYGLSVMGQLQHYQAAHGAYADPDALYVVWAGSNDLQDVLTLAATGDYVGANARLNEAVGDISSVINALLADGAQHLLVPSLTNFGLVPAIMANGPGLQAAATGYSIAFNDAMDTFLSGIPVDQAQIYRFSAFDLLNDMYANPGDYGLTQTSTPCLQNYYVTGVLDSSNPVSVCSDPESHLFWDIVHPSARTHEALAAGMLNAIPEPSSLALLGLGLMGLGMARRRR